MADWNVTLPAEAEQGASTHVQDHNAIVAAIRELRAAHENLDGFASEVSTTAETAQSAATEAKNLAVDNASRISALENQTPDPPEEV